LCFFHLHLSNLRNTKVVTKTDLSISSQSKTHAAMPLSCTKKLETMLEMRNKEAFGLLINSIVNFIESQSKTLNIFIFKRPYKKEFVTSLDFLSQSSKKLAIFKVQS